MPNNGTAKIKSAPKHRWYWGVALLVLGVAGLVWMILPHKDNTQDNTPLSSTSRSVTLTLSQQKYLLTAARTGAEQERGLGGTTSLALNRGMIFPYQGMAERCFWMKDMQYNLDILWVDSTKKIVHIEPNLSPDSYPRTFCAEGQYVIELLAGQAARAGLHTGQILSF